MPRRSDDNIVFFPESLHIGRVRDFIAILFDKIDQRGYEEVTLDFTRTKISFAEAMLPLIVTIMRYRDEKVRFRTKMPANEEQRRLFINCGWGQLMDSRVTHTPLSSTQHLPATRFTDSQSQSRVVTQAIDRVLKVAAIPSRETLSALEWAVNEITDNVLVHSKSEVGGLVQMSIHSKSKEIEFVVSDAGIGIPESMRLGQHAKLSDQEAIEHAIKEGVTSNPLVGQGNGLFGTFQICALSGGSFHINSGKAYLVRTRAGDVDLRATEQIIQGTSLSCLINYSAPQLLERALRFQGTPHMPIDLIDLYEDEEGYLVFNVREEAESTGSRLAAFQARKKLQEILRLSKANHLIIDFSGIGVLSSSFADEFIGKLANNLTMRVFKDRVRLRRLTASNLQIINRSFHQRLGCPLPGVVI